METRDRLRKIHLDFHNSPLIPDVGSEFEADRFADDLSRAAVNYVVCFAKCHHGMCYYNARQGRRHPSLTFDLLRAQIEACHKRDIAVSAYLSVVWEEEAARLHPEWQQLGPDGTPRHKIPGDRWATVCLNSPYIEEMLLPQVREVTENYEVDGLWFDMIHLDDNACYCRWCREKIKAMGLSYASEEDAFKFTAASVYGFLDKCSSLIRSLKPGVDIEYNSQVRLNPRGGLPHITGFEIECTPSERGYLYFPMFVRHARTFGLPVRGVTPRFHRIWADFGSVKNETQLRWETSTMLANGAGCSVGDQLHPRGTLDPLVYRRIGSAFEAVKECEEWCLGSVPITEAAILVDDDWTDFGIAKASDAVWGATRMLVESQVQFNLIDRAADFSPSRLLILADNRRLDEGTIGKLNAFVKTGGAVLAVGDGGWAERDGRFALEALPLIDHGLTETTANYIRLAESFRGAVEPFDYVIRYAFRQVIAGAGCDSLAQTILPYFERTPEHFTSHHQSPPDRPGLYPALIRKGRLMYCAAPLFAAYHRDGDTHCRQIFARCLETLLSDRLISVGLRPMLEVGLMRQGGRQVVHLVNYAATKRGLAPETIEAIPPLFGIPLRVRMPVAPTKVYLVPDRRDVPFEYIGGTVRCEIPRLDVQALLVIETEVP